MNNGGFAKGCYVVYGNNGICMIEDIKEMRFAAGMEKNTYYILKPASADASTVFVPADNEKLMAKMRPLMTKEEIDSLLLGMQGKEIVWNSDRRARNELFHDIMSKGITEDLLLMIGCIYNRKRESYAKGRKLPTMDSNILKSAEKLVEEEFAYVLQIPQKDVGKYIRDLMKVPETDEH